MGNKMQNRTRRPHYDILYARQERANEWGAHVVELWKMLNHAHGFGSYLSEKLKSSITYADHYTHYCPAAQGDLQQPPPYSISVLHILWQIIKQQIHVVLAQMFNIKIWNLKRPVLSQYIKIYGYCLAGTISSCSSLNQPWHLIGGHDHFRFILWDEWISSLCNAWVTKPQQNCVPFLFPHYPISSSQCIQTNQTIKMPILNNPFI